MTLVRRPPLTGVTVLEIGAFMAAPFANMHLADLGAEVPRR
jgi:crotonobetainyl-CoA:carnitine CoA-transferase CaiB-like acyl-CoA transferase